MKSTENPPLFFSRIINPCQEDHGRQGRLINHHQEGTVKLDPLWGLHGQCLGSGARSPFHTLLVHLQLSLVHSLWKQEMVSSCRASGGYSGRRWEAQRGSIVNWMLLSWKRGKGGDAMGLAAFLEFQELTNSE